MNGDAVMRFDSAQAELGAARDGAVLCDLSPIAALRVAGQDAASFLQGQLTNDVAALLPGAAQYSAWCSPKGRMLANFVLLRSAESIFDVLLPASLAAAIAKRLAMFVLRSRVTIEDVSGACVRLGLGGPGAAAALRTSSIDVPATFASSALDGGAIVALPAGRYVAMIGIERAQALWDRLSRAAHPSGFPAWQWLSIRAGVPVITPATSDKLVPQMANWDALDGVSFRKGCYTGQEIVARTQYLGRLKERTYIAHVDAPPPAPGEKLYSAAFGEQSCGMVLQRCARSRWVAATSSPPSRAPHSRAAAFDLRQRWVRQSPSCRCPTRCPPRKRTRPVARGRIA